MKVCLLHVTSNGLKDSERPDKIGDCLRIGLSLFCKMKTSRKARWFHEVEGIQKSAPAKLNAVSSVVFDICFVHPLKVVLQFGEFAWKKMEQFSSCFSYQLNAQFLYSITTYMLHYNPRHVSSSTMLIFRSNYIITASGIVTLCKRLYSTPVTIPDAVII